MPARPAAERKRRPGSGAGPRSRAPERPTAAVTVGLQRAGGLRASRTARTLEDLPNTRTAEHSNLPNLANLPNLPNAPAFPKRRTCQRAQPHPVSPARPSSRGNTPFPQLPSTPPFRPRSLPRRRRSHSHASAPNGGGREPVAIGATLRATGTTSPRVSRGHEPLLDGSSSLTSSRPRGRLIPMRSHRRNGRAPTRRTTR